MVLDSLKNGAFYNSLNKNLATAFAHLQKTDLAALAEGRYEIDGENVYMMIVEKDLKKPADAALEIHNVYIDIQVVISGSEGFGWKDREDCTAPRGEYSSEKDILFYDDKPTTYATLQAGEMAIFFPADAHAPLVGEGHVKKCIVKVKA